MLRRDRRLFPLCLGVLIAAVTLGGCGAAARYDPQVRLDLSRDSAEKAGVAKRDGLLWAVYRSGGGEWVELGNALAVARSDAVRLRRDDGVIVASAGVLSVDLTLLPAGARAVALAYRVDRPARDRDGHLGESAFYVVATIALAAAVVGIVVGIILLNDSDTVVRLNP